MLKFNQLTFLGPYLDQKRYKAKKQIALMGRSNVGKSSLINSLSQNKKTAKTSSTPGKTQSILCFQIDETNTYLIDLPGYGYAKVPSSVKKTFSKQITDYLQEQKNDLFVLFLLDIRHLPTPEDQDLYHWIESLAIPHFIILTKCDKLKKKEVDQMTSKVLRCICPEKDLSFMHYSVKQKLLRKYLIQKINQELYGAPS